MASGAGDLELSTEELRVVARYALSAAEEVLPLFEAACPSDPRARAAVDAARLFADGAPRTKLQRVAALEAHRAAAEAGSGAATHAAHAAGDAAAAAYLHPIARATQVGHILRAAAHAARATELAAGDDPRVGDREIERARDRATPAVVAVLRRYPPAPGGTTRVARLMTELDSTLRSR